MFDVTIIGGGAAGLFCAMEAAKRGRSVLVLERNAKPGRKILVSGGGRCNFTNNSVSAENFVSRNPHFCKSALAGYTPEDFIVLVKKHKIPFYEKKLGQLFCRGRSQEILDMLLLECARSGVKLIADCGVRDLSFSDRFVIDSNKGKFESRQLVIATGGPSFPKLGATDFGYSVARRFGLKVVEPKPSLVPLRFASEDYSRLAGLSIDCVADSNGHRFRENILFTHKGLSGPAVLQASNYWEAGGKIKFDLLPDTDISGLFRENMGSAIKVKNLLASHLPQRFIESFLPADLAQTPFNRLNEKQLHRLQKRIHEWDVEFSGTEGWHKAEVAIGGVDTNELSSKTMESKKIKGLYFIGEVADVTGWLGGYNFQWGWSSGFACAKAV